MSVKALLKKCWRQVPQPVRQCVLAFLCFIFAKTRRSASKNTKNIFILGAFCSSSGLGQGARLYAEQKRQNGENPVCIDITSAMLQRSDVELPQGVLSLEEGRCLSDSATVIIHANPPQFQLVFCRLGRQFLRNKYVVGYWAWELETIPGIWRHALKYVDAVEVPSKFVADAVRQHTDKPVSIVPHVVPVPSRKKTEYAPQGIVRCLYCFDFSSSYERKNPLAALRAFSLAFHPNEAEMTFKISGANASDSQFREFCSLCERTPGVHIITKCMSFEELEELYLQHDIYLSLHRSEGYGLTIREAQLHGLYVVATGWSGNMDFMSEPKSYSVPYRLVPVNMQSGPNKGLDAQWAEADTEAAAETLRKIGQKLLGGNHEKLSA